MTRTGRIDKYYYYHKNIMMRYKVGRAFLRDAPPEHWARSLIDHRRFGRYTNNISESLNSMVMIARMGKTPLGVLLRLMIFLRDLATKRRLEYKKEEWSLSRRRLAMAAWKEGSEKPPVYIPKKNHELFQSVP